MFFETIPRTENTILLMHTSLEPLYANVLILFYNVIIEFVTEFILIGCVVCLRTKICKYFSHVGLSTRQNKLQSVMYLILDKF